MTNVEQLLEQCKRERDALKSLVLKHREEFCWHGNTGKSLSADSYGRLVDDIDAVLDSIGPQS